MGSKIRRASWYIVD